MLVVTLRLLALVSLVVSLVTAFNAPLPASEDSALRELYQSMGGANWPCCQAASTSGACPGWTGPAHSPAADACSFRSVNDTEVCAVLDGGFHVRSLVFPDGAVQGGTLPTAIGALSYLETLVLADCSLLLPLPTELATLTRLKHIVFSGNGGAMNNVFPTQLPTSLVTLDVSDTALSGTLPSVQLDLLTTLQTLRLSDTSLDVELADNIGTLTALTTVVANNVSSLTGTLPTSLGALKQLETLQLHGVSGGLQGTLPSELALLTRLSSLDFDGSQLSGSVPSAMDVLSSQLSSCQMRGNAFSCAPSTVASVCALTQPLRDCADPPTQEITALQQLYSALGGDGWTCAGQLNDECQGWHGTGSASPIDNLHPCRVPSPLGWTGTDSAPLCTPTPTGMNVHSLALEDVGATGTLPEGWLSMQHLDRVDLSRNSISGTMPELLPLRVREVYLNDNQLSSTISNTLNGTTNPWLSVLTLARNSFSGTLPSTLATITTLHTLHLAQAGASLSGTVPSELGELTMLSVLSLAGPMQLSGTLPEEFVHLQNLHTLMLHHNSFSGTLASALANLTALTRLDLENNQLSGVLPTAFGVWTSMLTLRLAGNSLSGRVPTELEQLTLLSSCSLGFNAFDCVPSPLYSLCVSNPVAQLVTPSCGDLAPPSEAEALRSLYVKWGGEHWRAVIELTGWMTGDPCTTPTADGWTDNALSVPLCSRDGRGDLHVVHVSLEHRGLSGAVAQEIGALSHLEDLVLEHNSIVGTLPPELFTLTALGRLALGYNSISGTLPSQVGALHSLDTLTLEHTSISGTMPSELGRLTMLSVLRLHSTQLSGTVPSELGLITSLTQLTLSDNSFSGSLPAALDAALASVTACDLSGNSFSCAPATARAKCFPPSPSPLSPSPPVCFGHAPTPEGDTLRNFYSNTLGASWRCYADTPTPPCAHWQGDAASPPLSDPCAPPRWTAPPTSSGTLALECTDIADVGTHVTHLRMSNQGLGGIPPRSVVTVLTRLRVFDLSANALSGTLPSELGALTELEELRLDGNVHLSGEVPSELAMLATHALTDKSRCRLTNNAFSCAPAAVAAMCTLPLPPLPTCDVAVVQPTPPGTPTLPPLATPPTVAQLDIVPTSAAVSPSGSVIVVVSATALDEMNLPAGAPVANISLPPASEPGFAGVARVSIDAVDRTSLPSLPSPLSPPSPPSLSMVDALADASQQGRTLLSLAVNVSATAADGQTPLTQFGESTVEVCLLAQETTDACGRTMGAECLAFWNMIARRWECVDDSDAQPLSNATADADGTLTVCGQTSHFTPFAVLSLPSDASSSSSPDGGCGNDNNGNVDDDDNNSNNNSNADHGSGTNVPWPAVAAGIVAGLVLLVIVIVVVHFVRLRREATSKQYRLGDELRAAYGDSGTGGAASAHDNAALSRQHTVYDTQTSDGTTIDSAVEANRNAAYTSRAKIEDSPLYDL